MGGGVSTTAGSAATVLKNALEGDIHELQSIVKVLDCVFIDEEFPPDPCILGFPRKVEDDIIWMRPHEFGSGVLFSKDPDPADCLHAAKRKDCATVVFLSDFLVPAVSALCKRPDYIRSLFLLYNPNAGVAVIKLWVNHQLETIVIDDHCPCDKYTFQPYFSSVANGDAWLPLLEKAFAKRFGSYRLAVPTGGVKDLLRDLTGEVVLEVDHAAVLHAITYASADGNSINSYEQGSTPPGIEDQLFDDLVTRFQLGLCVMNLLSTGTTAPFASINATTDPSSDSQFISNHHPRWSTITDLGMLSAGEDATFQAIASYPSAMPRYTTLLSALPAEVIAGATGKTSFEAMVGSKRRLHKGGPTIATVSPDSHFHSNHSANQNNNKPSIHMQTSSVQILDNEYAWITEYRPPPAPEARKKKPKTPEERRGRYQRFKSSQSLTLLGSDGSSILSAQPSVDSSVTGVESEAPPVISAEEPSTLMERFERATEAVPANKKWTSWHKCLQDYQSLYITLLRPTAKTTRKEYVTTIGRWDTSAGTAPGCYHCAGWRRNPLYRLKAKKRISSLGKISISVCLSQPENRIKHNKVLAAALANQSSRPGSRPQQHITDTDRKSGGQKTYPAIAITACIEHVLLRDIVVDSGYRSERDVYIRLDLTHEASSLILVPSTLDQNVDMDFYLSVMYTLDCNESECPVELELMQEWNGLPHYQEVKGEWSSESAAGRISNLRPYSGFNPCWKLTFDLPSEPQQEAGTAFGDYDSSNPFIQLNVILSPHDNPTSAQPHQVATAAAFGSEGWDSSSLLSGEPGGEQAPLVFFEYQHCGCYIMTPLALSKLVYQEGYCGSGDLKQGYLGKLAFQSLPVTTREEKFRLLANDIADVRSYRELVLMPATWWEGFEAPFRLEVFCNVGFTLEPIDVRSNDQRCQFPVVRALSEAERRQMLSSATFSTPENAAGAAELLLSIDLAATRTISKSDPGGKLHSTKSIPSANTSTVLGEAKVISVTPKIRRIVPMGTGHGNQIQPRQAHSIGTSREMNTTQALYPIAQTLAAKLPSSKEVLVNMIGVTGEFHKSLSRVEYDEKLLKEQLMAGYDKPRRKKILRKFDINGIILLSDKNYFANEMPDDEKYRYLFEKKRPEYYMPMDDKNVIPLGETMRKQMTDLLHAHKRLMSTDNDEENDDENEDYA